MTNDIRKEAFTIREFAEAYGVPVRSLYRMWSQGTGPERTRIGERKIIITRPAGERWLAKHAEGVAAAERNGEQPAQEAARGAGVPGVVPPAVDAGRVREAEAGEAAA